MKCSLYGLIGLIGAILLGLTVPAQGQSTDTLNAVLPTVEIQASRSGATTSTAPFTATIQSRSPERVALEAPASLTQTLGDLPGVWLNNRENMALGERLSIRGMGWRSAFGVRGVLALLDGIPLTMPDGQATLDIVEPAFIQQSEVIRGPASSLWGNASGGILFLSTTPPSDESLIRIRALGGSYGRKQVAGEAWGQLGRQQVGLSVSHTRQDGYRDYSRFERTRAIASLRRSWARTTLRVVGAFLDIPTSQNPGGLNAETAAADPRSAVASFVNARAGKESRQGQVGATLDTQTRVGLLSATTYGLFRNIENPLTFAYVRLRRVAGGTRIALRNTEKRVHWTIGVDGNGQSDDRFNWNNDAGQPGTDLQLDQNEQVTNLAGFGEVRTTWQRLHLQAGLRYDRLRFEADDKLLVNGDQSGHRIFDAWSPSVGLAFATEPALLFANFRTAFESPTTTEIVNRPDLVGGFNPDLQPQRTTGVEAGIRGSTDRQYFEAAVFHMRVRDRLIPFQTEEGGDRTFYRNQGATVHTGLEGAVTWIINPAWMTQWTFSLSRFRFTDDSDLDDKQLPGLPTHRVHGNLRWQHRGLWIRTQFEAVSSYYVNDANTAKNEGYAVLDLYVGHTGIRATRGLALQPYVHLTNLTGTRYNGSVTINAFGGRYYEPAAERAFALGINFVLSKI